MWLRTGYLQASTQARSPTGDSYCSLSYSISWSSHSSRSVARGFRTRRCASTGRGADFCRGWDSDSDPSAKTTRTGGEIGSTAGTEPMRGQLRCCRALWPRELESHPSHDTAARTMRKLQWCRRRLCSRSSKTLLSISTLATKPLLFVIWLSKQEVVPNRAPNSSTVLLGVISARARVHSSASMPHRKAPRKVGHGLYLSYTTPSDAGGAFAALCLIIGDGLKIEMGGDAGGPGGSGGYGSGHRYGVVPFAHSHMRRWKTFAPHLSRTPLQRNTPWHPLRTHMAPGLPVAGPAFPLVGKVTQPKVTFGVHLPPDQALRSTRCRLQAQAGTQESTPRRAARTARFITIWDAHATS
jgi:hypothetical protein